MSSARCMQSGDERGRERGEERERERRTDARKGREGFLRSPLSLSLTPSCFSTLAGARRAQGRAVQEREGERQREQTRRPDLALSQPPSLSLSMAPLTNTDTRTHTHTHTDSHTHTHGFTHTDTHTHTHTHTPKRTLSFAMAFFFTVSSPLPSSLCLPPARLASHLAALGRLRLGRHCVTGAFLAAQRRQKSREREHCQRKAVSGSGEGNSAFSAARYAQSGAAGRNRRLSVAAAAVHRVCVCVRVCVCTACARVCVSGLLHLSYLDPLSPLKSNGLPLGGAGPAAATHPAPAPTRPIDAGAEAPSRVGRSALLPGPT